MRRQDRIFTRRKRRKIIRNRILLGLFIVLLIFGAVKFGPKLKDTMKDIGSIFKFNKDGKGGKGPEGKDPVIDPDQEKPEEPRTSEMNLLAVGDIMFHMPQIQSARKAGGGYDFSPPFEYVKKYIDGADIAIANFETVTAGDNRRFSGFPQFNSPKDSLLGIKEAGFDILSTANNHSLDQGKTGVLNTLKYIEEFGLESTGTYSEANVEPLIKEVNDIRLGFLSYTYGLNGLEGYLSKEELSYMINLIDEDKIKEDIDNIKSKDIDVLVVSVHWGIEYQREANDYQIELGHKLVDWGANIVLGSHPHVIQKTEIVKKDNRDNFIIYSMGNFLSNQRKETMGNSYTEDGVMVNINIEKDLDTKESRIKNIDLIPTWIHKYMEAGKAQYRILPLNELLEGDLDLVISDPVFQRIKKSHEDTMSTLRQK